MLEDERYRSVEFIDDHRLLVGFGSPKGSPPSVVLMDTQNNLGGVPMQTFFHLPSYLGDSRYRELLFEPGAHNPSSAEYLAPFLQDRTQRIAVLSLYPLGYLVFPVETLLSLSEGHEGRKIGWDEWKIHAAIASVPQAFFTQVWVSGCRLFCLSSAGITTLEVYDFSMRGRVKYLSEKPDVDLGGVRHLASTGTNWHIPWVFGGAVTMNGGHNSIMFFHVSVLLISCTIGLSNTLDVVV